MRGALVLGLCAAVTAAACGGDSKSPSTPTPVVNPKLTAPALESPVDGAQLDTLARH